MSLKTKKQGSDGDGAGASTAAVEETPPRRRGRPRKVVAEATEAATSRDEAGAGPTASEPTVDTEVAAPAAAPKRRGRPPKAKPQVDGQPQATAAATAPAATSTVESVSPSEQRPAQESAGEHGATAHAGSDAAAATGEPARDRGRERGRDGAGGRDRGAERGAERGGDRGGNRASEAGRGAQRAQDDAQRDEGRFESQDDDDDSDDGGEQGEQGGRGRNGRNRRQRANRKAGLNFRELYTKMLPELHLLAKEVGLEDYRSMNKDELTISILERSTEQEGLRLVRGYLEISSDGYGFLQESLLQNNTRSVIVSAGLIKQFRLRTGDFILGKARRPRDNERYGTLIRVEAVNNVDPFQASKRPRFEELVPTFPDTRIQLETVTNELPSRVIDLLAPIGRGQRGLIVAPPKAGKTTLLKKIATAVSQNEPDIKVIVLLVDERPEEVTDFRESVQGVEVIASTFDEPPANHIRVAEFVHERARRIVEDSGHVMILLDSLTRLARANNLVTPPTGRTLSGGLDSNALHWPKRFLGAARNIRGGGSLSILATALVETGSRMDDVIFEEFKGTGNMELHLSRHLEERRIFPAIDILKSGTRREDLLLGEEVLAKMWLLRKVISDMDPAEAMEMLLSRLGRTKSNAEFLSTLGHG